MDRRDFLKLSGYVFVTSLLPFGFFGWAAGLPEFASLNDNERKRFIVLFQRGAVDGLNVVIPHNETYYYDSRPTIGIPTPGSPLGALELNNIFGLHPSLNNILPLWKGKSLGFVHACGSPDPSRSHFEAQDYMETGTPGEKNTKDGWLNRLLANLSSSQNGTIKAISMGASVPRILSGKMPVANIPSIGNPALPIVTDRPFISKEFDQLYKNDKDLGEVYREGIKARKQLLKDLEEERKIADHGAPSPKGFAENCHRLAQIIAKDPTMQIAFLDVGGWDTHINQGGTSGQLANHLKEFGDGILALTKGLGDAFKNTVITVISEFGRTVKENGHGGTDHGHGNVMWVIGGSIKGGKVYGDWPGLAAQDLYENRDLMVTTDFRSVLGYLVGKHFNISSEAVNSIFPKVPSSRNSSSFYSGLM